MNQVPKGSDHVLGCVPWKHAGLDAQQQRYKEFPKKLELEVQNLNLGVLPFLAPGAEKRVF